MRDRFVKVTGDLLEEDPKTVVVLAVISRRLFADAGLTRRFKDRIIDVGIREQTQIGVAGGLALEGFSPIVSGYAPFLVERPFEQIKLSLSHQDVSAVLLSVGGSWDSADSGRTHQSPGDVDLISTLPDWTVHVPGHPDELEVLLRASHEGSGSAYIRTTTESNARPYTTVPGRIVTLRRGSPSAPTVLVVGTLADQALAGLDGLDVTLLYTSTPTPIDGRGLRASVLGDELIVVEPYQTGTSIARIAEAMTDRPMRLRAHGVTNEDLRRYGTPLEHRAAHGLDAAGIREFVVGGSIALAS
ncbi:MAG: transketolase family protein [Acidimicrobiia bacterium]